MVLLVWRLRALVFIHGRRDFDIYLVIKVKGGGICFNFDSDTKIKDGKREINRAPMDHKNY